MVASLKLIIALLNASDIQRKIAHFCRRKKKCDAQRRSLLEMQRSRQRLPFCPEADIGDYFSVDYFASKTGEQHEF